MGRALLVTGALSVPGMATAMTARAATAAVPAAAAVGYVVPPTPIAAPSLLDTRCRSMVSKSSYYFSTYWWKTRQRYPASGIPVIRLGSEREASNVAITMAVTADWHGYLPSAVRLDLADVRLRAAKLVIGVARRHRVNTTGPSWGHTWQSAYWAYACGLAGWLLWNSQLTNKVDRAAVAAMVVDEADFQLTRHWPEFWLHTENDALYPVSGAYTDGPHSRAGDSAMEENLWNATVLSLAGAMMPGHPSAAAWRSRAAQFTITGLVRKADALDEVTAVNGRSIQNWCADAAPAGSGYNLPYDYVVVNHGKCSPDYMQASFIPLTCAIHNALANVPTPEAHRYNAKRVYGAMRTVLYVVPGVGTRAMYASTSSPTLYFPCGVDWGMARHAGYWAWDSLVDTMVFGGTDSVVPVAAGTWDRVHGNAAIAMQNRAGVMPGGQIVLRPVEDSYPGREGWHASNAAFVVLNKLVTNAGRVSWTNDAL